MYTNGSHNPLITYVHILNVFILAQNICSHNVLVILIIIQTYVHTDTDMLQTILMWSKSNNATSLTTLKLYWRLGTSINFNLPVKIFSLNSFIWIGWCYHQSGVCSAKIQHTIFPSGRTLIVQLAWISLDIILAIQLDSTKLGEGGITLLISLLSYMVFRFELSILNKRLEAIFSQNLFNSIPENRVVIKSPPFITIFGALTL